MKNELKSDAIENEILEFIVSRNLKAGDKLPNEYELAQITGVGRGTIREGVRALVSRNILVVKRGSGTYVASADTLSNSSLGLEFLIDKNKLVMDTMEIRFLIEPYIASKSAINATDEQKIEIERLCNEVDELIKKGENHIPKDVEFHTMIAKSCGNSVMSRIIPLINQAIYLFGDATNLGLKESTSQVHREIVEAIKEGNPTKAHDAMYLHLVYNRRMINKEK